MSFFPSLWGREGGGQQLPPVGQLSCCILVCAPGQTGSTAARRLRLFLLPCVPTSPGSSHSSLHPAPLKEGRIFQPTGDDDVLSDHYPVKSVPFDSWLARQMRLAVFQPQASFPSSSAPCEPSSAFLLWSPPAGEVSHQQHMLAASPGSVRKAPCRGGMSSLELGEALELGAVLTNASVLFKAQGAKAVHRGTERGLRVARFSYGAVTGLNRWIHNLNSVWFA